MSRPLNRFNWLARHYDFLTRLVFGTAMFNSHVHFFKCIPQGSQILVVGGGSGAILPCLCRDHPTCGIWYVEASSEMLSKASERITRGPRDQIKFIHGTEESVPEGIAFDVIITHFVLDLFPNEKGFAFCRNLCEKLQPDGLWLISDFVDGRKWWQQVMLWVMYRFFVLTCKIEATVLPSWEYQLRMAGMRERAFKLFFLGFIKSAVYSKEAGQ